MLDKNIRLNKFIRGFAIALRIVFVLVVLFLILIHTRRPFVKILAYHSVSDEQGIADPRIGKGLFARQMDFLFAHGYEPVFLSTALQRYKEDAALPPNWIVLTFDAERPDFYSDVYPLLQKYQFKATVFVRTDYVENGCPSWGQLRQMRESGLVEIGSHSVGHPALTCLLLAQAKNEIVTSKAILEENIGSRVLTFSYPYGAVNNEVEDLVRQAGYAGAVGTVYRMGEFAPDDVYALNRIYVSKISRFPFVFRFMVSGYYVPTRAWALRLLNIKVPRFADDCRVWENYEMENLFKH